MTKPHPIHLDELVIDVEKALDGIYDLNEKWAEVSSTFAEHGLILDRQESEERTESDGPTNTITLITDKQFEMSRMDTGDWIMGGDHKWWVMFLQPDLSFKRQPSPVPED